MRKLQFPEVEDTQLNLIPIMNLLTALIPFLLLSATFYHVSIIQVSVPVASEGGETDVEKEPDAITLTLQVLPDRIELGAQSDAMSEKELDEIAATIPRKPAKEASDEEDFTALTDKAFELKTKYAESDTVIVVPKPDIPYNEVVSVMDAVRKTTRDVAGQIASVSVFQRVVLFSKLD